MMASNGFELSSHPRWSRGWSMGRSKRARTEYGLNHVVERLGEERAGTYSICAVDCVLAFSSILLVFRRRMRVHLARDIRRGVAPLGDHLGHNCHRNLFRRDCPDFKSD